MRPARLMASRWISIAGNRIQPSEFLKPCFALTTAWLLARQQKEPRFKGVLVALALFLMIVAILKKQPDVGMMAVIGAVFMSPASVDRALRSARRTHRNLGGISRSPEQISTNTCSHQPRMVASPGTGPRR